MKKYQLLPLCAAFFFGSSISAQNVVSESFIWNLSYLNEFNVSPQNNKIVVGIRKNNLAENKGNTDLFVLNTNGSGFTQITNTPESESNIVFSADGNFIYYLSNAGGKSEIWRMNADGSNPTAITKSQNDIEGFGLSADNKKVFFISEVKIYKNTIDKHSDLQKTTGKVFDGLMYRHWTAWEDGLFKHVFVADFSQNGLTNIKDIMQGEPYDAPLNPFGGVEQICFSPDGNTLVYSCKKLEKTAYATSTNSDLYAYNFQTGETKNLSTFNKGYDLNPQFSPDGKFLVWNSMERDGYEADKNRLMQLEISTGKTTDLTDKFDQNAQEFVWSKDGSKIYFLSETIGTVQVYELTKGKSISIKQITKGRHNYSHISYAESNKKPILYGTKMSMDKPNELFSIDPKTGVETAITNINTQAYSNIKLAKVEQRFIKASDGQNIQTWFIYPPDFDSTKKYPTLLYCQGGPQSMVGQSFSTRWNFQLMAAKGYIVVAPNRRGLPGFGQKWNEQISGDWGGQAMSDLLSAIDSAAKLPFVNAGKLGAVGASFGGYSVYWLAGNHENRFKAFISHCGVFNLESMYGHTEEMFFINFDMQGSYWDNKTMYEKYSPHNYVKNWNTPILVIHNEKDFRVPLSEGMQAFNAAQLQGVPSKFLYFPDEGHWVTKPQNAALWAREFYEFLDQYLK